jgi:tetratricopeptide (TPR) repeat protein
VERDGLVDFVLLGIRDQVIPIGRALAKREYSVSYLFGEESPSNASKLIAKSKRAAVMVGVAPSIRHRKVVKALIRCRKRNMTILIDNPYGLSVTRLADKIIESAESTAPEFRINYVESIPTNDHDQIRNNISYYDKPSPERAAAWHKRAVESLNDGWIEDAIAFCEGALRSDQFHEEAIYFKQKLHQLVKSETCLLNHIDKLIASQKMDQASRVLRFVQSKYSESVGALIKEGQMRLTSNDLKGATKAYDSALRIDKRNLGALVGLSTVHILMGNYAFAVDFAKTALKIDPMNLDALINMSGALVNIGSPKAALKYADKVIRRTPKSHIAWYNKGHALMQLGKFEEAKKCLMESINIEPNYSFAWNGISKIINLGH